MFVVGTTPRRPLHLRRTLPELVYFPADPASIGLILHLDSIEKRNVANRFTRRISMLLKGKSTLSVVGSESTIELILKENKVIIADHEKGSLIEKFVDGPMKIPKISHIIGNLNH